MNLPIFMDHHSTTPVDPQVLAEMLPYFSENFGNAASRTHVFGWRAEEAVEMARSRIAALIGAADPKEIIFSSGATEANNLALKGVAEFHSSKGRHIITCVTEHKAVLDTCKELERKGNEVTYLPVDRFGTVDIERLSDAITPGTILISLMYGNNEIGTLHDIHKIGKLAKEKEILFHSDATQAVGKIPVNVNEMQVDLMSFSAHKMYGPKGIGCLYVRKKNPRVRITAQMHGGGHERGIRSGTLNVPGIVGFGKACEVASRMMPEEMSKVAALRDRLHAGLESRLDEIFLNGHPEKRLPNNLNLSFAYVEGESLLMSLDDVAVSSGSACTSATQEPSHVLKALGIDDERAHTSIRFGLGRFNTAEEVDYVIDKVTRSVTKLREISPLWKSS